jgi:hypothetical protein
MAATSTVAMEVTLVTATITVEMTCSSMEKMEATVEAVVVCIWVVLPSWAGVLQEAQVVLVVVGLEAEVARAEAQQLAERLHQQLEEEPLVQVEQATTITTTSWFLPSSSHQRQQRLPR